MRWLIVRGAVVVILLAFAALMALLKVWLYAAIARRMGWL